MADSTHNIVYHPRKRGETTLAKNRPDYLDYFCIFNTFTYNEKKGEK
jgi:hypothetical protein